MDKLITGIHHVTAVSGNAQENIDFYTGFLGLRLIKKTVNYDDPSAYHFYFGDEHGNPGTIMTTFPYGNDLQKGRDGNGKINTTAFSLPWNSIDFWLERLDKFNILFKHPQQRFEDEVFIYLEDYDGLGLELVFTQKENRPGYFYGERIPEEHSIRGIHHIELWVEAFEKTGALLTSVLNHQLIAESSNRFRYAVEDAPGQYIDILWTPNALKGFPGRGMVHHVAFATPSTESQLKLMDKIFAFGLQTTEVVILQMPPPKVRGEVIVKSRWGESLNNFDAPEIISPHHGSILSGNQKVQLIGKGVPGSKITVQADLTYQVNTDYYSHEFELSAKVNAEGIWVTESVYPDFPEQAKEIEYLFQVIQISKEGVEANPETLMIKQKL